MSRKSNVFNIAMSVAFVLSLFAIGAITIYFKNILQNPSSTLPGLPIPSPSPATHSTSPNPTTSSSPTPTPSPSERPRVLADLKISKGEKILIRQEEGNLENIDFITLKNQGTKYISQDKYTDAAVSFNNALIKYPNAPETRIYYNNARIGDKKAYSIAVIVRSDGNPQESLKVLRGVAQAQDEVNSQGGINGTPLKVIIVNDDNNKKVAPVMAKIIANRTDVLGVVGHYSSGCTIAAGQVYGELKLVSISGTSTANEISNLNPYVYRTVPKDSIAGKTIADYAIRNQLNSAIVVFDNESDYSKSLKSAFVENLKAQQGNIIEEIDLSQPGINYIEKIKQLSNQAQGLMLALPDTRLAEVSAIGSANQGKMKILGGDDLYNIKILQSKQISSLVGMVLVVPWTIDNKQNTPFVKQSKALWKGNVDWQTAMTYDAAKALIYAIKASPEPTRETVRNALNNPDFNAPGASDLIKFNQRDREGSDRLVRVEKRSPSQSGTGYDFVETNHP
jgi:branched-chain amino acid transport system substrate-binding protein